MRPSFPADYSANSLDVKSKFGRQVFLAVRARSNGMNILLRNFVSMVLLSAWIASFIGCILVILLCSTKKEMVWIYAGWIVAMVAYRQRRIGDGTNKNHVSHSVCLVPFFVLFNFTVSKFISCTNPNVAWAKMRVHGRSVLIYLSKKFFFSDGAAANHRASFRPPSFRRLATNFAQCDRMGLHLNPLMIQVPFPRMVTAIAGVSLLYQMGGV